MMRVVATGIVALLLFASCSGEPADSTTAAADQPPLLISNVDVQGPIPGTSMGRAYMTFQNTTDAPISITRVTSPSFASVQIHESVIEDGISRMRSIDQLTIAGNDTVALQPGGIHLMLHGALAGDNATEFSFYAGESLIAKLSVEAKD